MSIPRCVPWASWPEWDAVHLGLFGGDPLAQRSALEVVRNEDARPLPEYVAFDNCLLPPPFFLSLPLSQPRLPPSFFFLHPNRQQVSAWRSRGRLPLGVDATAAFVEAEIE